MAVSLGSNQFLFVDGIRIPTKLGYVGHCLEESAIPEEGIVEVRMSASFDGIDYVAGRRAVLFKGSKKEFLRWQEEFNGW
jgi:hypothetical protein